jgi:hypothetical protein
MFERQRHGPSIEFQNSDSFLPEYDVASLDNRFPMFPVNVVAVSSRVKCPRKLENFQNGFLKPILSRARVSFS